jgi:hypothetical protein
MEALALVGLLGVGYVINKATSKIKSQQQQNQLQAEQQRSGNMPPGVTQMAPPVSSSVTSVPYNETYTGVYPFGVNKIYEGKDGIGASFESKMSDRGVEGFMPAQRGTDTSALTLAPKGGSAVGFGPELDMMYQYPNGQTYPSEPNPGPYGTALGYATQQPPLAPIAGPPGPFVPKPSPLDVNKPLVEYRGDGIEESPVYAPENFVVSPLSGERIPAQDFTHNNMQPFFGGSIKQNTVAQQNQSILDQYNGSGSTQIRKREVENMFETSRAPYGNPFGMEDNTDFFQSRMQDPISRDGERPFEPVKVGSAIGEKFGLLGKGGFQQIEINEIMRPKDTDELRVATNPKLTYNQPVVPGARFVAVSQDDPGEVRKYRPDRYYIDETGERFFVTNGELIKESTRPVQVLPFVTRPETSVEYIGVAMAQDAGESYVSGTYRLPMTQQYGGAGYRNADMTTYYTPDVLAQEADYGKSSYEIRPNERTETSERVIATNLVPADTGQVTQPFEDPARPTRRGETIGTLRITGTPVKYSGGAPAVSVWDPSDIARTTVRESTIYLDRPGIASPASAPTRLKVYDPDDISKPTQKAQLSANLSWTGPGISSHRDSIDETFAYNMRTKNWKEAISRGRRPIAGSGEVATFNGNPGRQTSHKLDNDFLNDRPMSINREIGGGGLGPGVGDIGRVHYRTPLILNIARDRNQPSMVEAVVNNPLMKNQSLQQTAEHDQNLLNRILGGFKNNKKTTV